MRVHNRPTGADPFLLHPSPIIPLIFFPSLPHVVFKGNDTFAWRVIRNFLSSSFTPFLPPPPPLPLAHLCANNSLCGNCNIVGAHHTDANKEMETVRERESESKPDWRYLILSYQYLNKKITILDKIEIELTNAHTKYGTWLSSTHTQTHRHILYIAAYVFIRSGWIISANFYTSYIRTKFRHNAVQTTTQIKNPVNNALARERTHKHISNYKNKGTNSTHYNSQEEDRVTKLDWIFIWKMSFSKFGLETSLPIILIGNILRHIKFYTAICFPFTQLQWILLEVAFINFF